MVHKLLMCSLGRLEEDDRDHYGKRNTASETPTTHCSQRYAMNSYEREKVGGGGVRGEKQAGREISEEPAVGRGTKANPPGRGEIISWCGVV